LLRLEQRHGSDYEFDPEDADRSYRVCELLEGVRRKEYGPPVPLLPSERPSWWAEVATWRFFSIACGAGAVLVTIAIWLLPSNEWRAAVGGLMGLGLLVTALMLSMNPAYFYRRALSYVIPAGLLLNGIGFTFDVVAPGGRFYWNGTVSGWFFAAWAVVVGWLVVGDLKQTR
jgi:hypothetical protein